MQLGLFTDALADRPLPDVLDWLSAAVPEVRVLEIGLGGYSSAPHRDDLGVATARGYAVGALNASGNPLADPEHDRTVREAIALAANLGVGRVVCMSGGDPRFSGGGWFPGLEEGIEREWEEDVLPYWREVGALAERAGVRLCFELEPGSAAYRHAPRSSTPSYATRAPSTTVSLPWAQPIRSPTRRATASERSASAARSSTSAASRRSALRMASAFGSTSTTSSGANAQA